MIKGEDRDKVEDPALEGGPSRQKVAGGVSAKFPALLAGNSGSRARDPYSLRARPVLQLTTKIFPLSQDGLADMWNTEKQKVAFKSLAQGVT